MGTVVFPEAKVKIFLIASLETRINRRRLQLQEKGINVNLICLEDEIKKRDERDLNRTFSPLLPDKKAWMLDSTDISAENLAEKALIYVNKNLISDYD
jgi:cytidylate kinase